MDNYFKMKFSYQHIPTEPKDLYIGMTQSGYAICFDQDEMDLLESIPRPEEISFTTHSIAQTFPDAKSTIKKILKQREVSIKILLDEWENQKRRVAQLVKNPINYPELFNMAKAWYLEIPLKPLLGDQKRLKQILSFMEIKELPPGQIDLLVELPRAKSVPITDFIKFNHSGFAPCIFHTESTPSMKYYKKQNRVECFGCHNGGDCIDVVRQLYNLDVLHAVKFILKK